MIKSQNDDRDDIDKNGGEDDHKEKCKDKWDESNNDSYVGDGKSGGVVDSNFHQNKEKERQ